MIKIVIITFFIGYFAGSQANKHEPHYRGDYKYIPELRAFYKYHKVKANFSDAVSLCVAEGAELFMPSSKLESDRVLEIVDKVEHYIWLGMHDIYSEGHFIKLDGTPVEDSYTNWAYGEPNNNNDQEDCGVMWVRYGSFNDGTCFTKAPFVCKRTSEDLEHNTICETYDLDYVYSIDMDSCYKLHTQPKNWMEAFVICKAEESEMVVVNNRDEANFLVKQILSKPLNIAENADVDNFHLGFNDLLIQGVYMTTHGKTLFDSGYEKWASGQPNNQNGTAHCGGMQRSGLLSLVNCGKKSMFFCEKRLSNGGDEPVINDFEGSDFSMGGAVVELPDA